LVLGCDVGVLPEPVFTVEFPLLLLPQPAMTAVPIAAMTSTRAARPRSIDMVTPVIGVFNCLFVIVTALQPSWFNDVAIEPIGIAPRASGLSEQTREGTDLERNQIRGRHRGGRGGRGGLWQFEQRRYVVGYSWCGSNHHLDGRSSHVRRTVGGREDSSRREVRRRPDEWLG
jgi:hypothetical protein